LNWDILDSLSRSDYGRMLVLLTLMIVRQQ